MCESRRVKPGDDKSEWVVLKIESDVSASLRGAKRRSNPCLSQWSYGLLRGACHRARIRATRWLAMTVREARAYDSRISKSLRPSFLSSFFTALEAAISPSLA